MNNGGDKKVITINPDLFKLSKNTTRKNKAEPKRDQKPIKIKSINRDKTIKRDMLRRIRANQSEQYDKLFKDTTPSNNPAFNQSNHLSEEKFESGFKDTMDFMNKLVDKHKRAPEIPVHNQTIRNISQNANPIHMPLYKPLPASIPASNVMQVPTPMVMPMSNIMPMSMATSIPMPMPMAIPMVMPTSMPLTESITTTPMVFSQPQYGCLKNGALPTYRTAMNKTAKVADEPVAIKSNNAIERIRARLNERANRPINLKIPKINPNKIIRRTYHVGKDKFRPIIGVLLPNRTIRNNVTNKAFMLKNTPIDEIRKFLLKNGFIKVGSTSPNDVLHKMYESVMMIDGDIKNHNPDNLLYNFFNDKSV
jgi:hypothetical protein